MCRLSWILVSLNLLEPSGPVQACTGIALPFYLEMYSDHIDAVGKEVSWRYQLAAESKKKARKRLERLVLGRKHIRKHGVCSARPATSSYALCLGPSRCPTDDIKLRGPQLCNEKSPSIIWLNPAIYCWHLMTGAVRQVSGLGLHTSNVQADSKISL